MRCFSKFTALILLIFSFFSCSLNTSAIGNSKIYFIGVGLDYYGMTNALSTCNNDIYAVTKQFYTLSADNKIESLLFLRSAEDEYVLEGFDDSNFQRYGIQVKSAASTTGPTAKSFAEILALSQEDKSKFKTDIYNVKGMWMDTDASGNVIIFRIGCSGLLDSQTQEISPDDLNNEDNWGSCLQYYNASTEKSPYNIFLTYTPGLSVYIFDSDKTVERSIILRPMPIVKRSRTSRESFKFTYGGKEYQDESKYEVDDSNLSASGVASRNGFKPSLLYKIDENDKEHFFIYKCALSTKTSWGWLSENTSAINTINVPDKINSWFANKTINPDDVVVFYYTGHGAGYGTGDYEKTNEAGGSLCFRGDTANSINNIPPRTILNLFENNKVLEKCHKVYIIDSCYSGNFVRIADNSSLSSVENYGILYSSNGICDVYDSSQFFRPFFQSNDYKGSSDYTNSWILSATTARNTSYAGTDIYEGTGARFSAFTVCLLDSLGYDVVNARSTTNMNGKRITLYGIYNSIAKSFPDYYRKQKIYEEAQNPQAILNPVDLILF